LNFDACRGINLDTNSLKIDLTRWIGRVIGDSPLDKNQYDVLDSISNYGKANDISLVFVQSPCREGY